MYLVLNQVNFKLNISTSLVKKGLLSSLVLVFFYFVMSSNPLGLDSGVHNRLFSTFSTLNNYEDDKNSVERVKQWEDSYKYFIESPVFGTGNGGFAALHKGKDIRFYPHNILVEIIVELGVVGTFLIFYIFYYLRKQFFKYCIQNKDFSQTLFYLFILGFITSLSSLEFPNQFMFFNCLSLLLVMKYLVVFECEN